MVIASGETPELPKVYQYYAFYKDPGSFLELTVIFFDEVLMLLEHQHIQVEDSVALVWRPWPDNYYHSVSHFAKSPGSESMSCVGDICSASMAPTKLGSHHRSSHMHLQVVESLFNVYQLSCTYLKLCTHASVTSQLTAIFTDKPKQFLLMDWKNNFPAVYEAAKCYTKDIVELHLPSSFNQVRHYH